MCQRGGDPIELAITEASAAEGFVEHRHFWHATRSSPPPYSESDPGLDEPRRDRHSAGSHAVSLIVSFTCVRGYTPIHAANSRSQVTDGPGLP
jgi:hypothetical protein